MGNPVNKAFQEPAVIFTEEQLSARAEYWQEVLGLQDWDIRTEIVRERDLELGKVSGEVEIIFTKKIAIIRIMDHTDYGKGTDRFLVAQNMGKDLIHEMLHIFLFVIEDNIDSHLSELLHQDIEILATALYELDRKNAVHGVTSFSGTLTAVIGGFDNGQGNIQQ